MNSFFIFWSVFSFFSKEFFSCFKFIFIDCYSFFMVMLFPLIFSVVSFSSFSKSLTRESLFNILMFFFFFFFLFFCFISCFSYIFLFSLEMGSFAMILFILNFSKDQDKISSVVFMFLINLAGSIPFMLFSFSYKFSFLLFNSIYFSCSFSDFIFFSFIMISKLPLFLLHFWLTKAHVAASGVGSIILASLMLKIASLGLMKWGMYFSFLIFDLLLWVLSFLILSGIFFLFVMNRFFDLKYLVACSSVLHVMFSFPFFIYSSPGSFYSSCLMMVSHSLTSCIVFFLVSVLYEVNQDRSILSNKSLESFSYFFSLFFLVWLILNLGFPPLISFYSELFFLLVLKKISLIFSAFFLSFILFSGIYFINFCVGLVFYKKATMIKNMFFLCPGNLSFFIFFSFLFSCWFL